MERYSVRFEPNCSLTNYSIKDYCSTVRLINKCSVYAMKKIEYVSDRTNILNVVRTFTGTGLYYNRILRFEYSQGVLKDLRRKGSISSS
jgi:hypothetical protein